MAIAALRYAHDHKALGWLLASSAHARASSSLAVTTVTPEGVNAVAGPSAEVAAPLHLDGPGLLAG